MLPHILLVEDNKADVYLIREAIAGSRLQAELHVVEDGEKAIAFIDRADETGAGPCPNLFLLDLNLPKRNGIEVLQHIRQSSKCRGALVVIITSSNSERDRLQTAELGANAYFRKPSTYEAFLKLGDLIKEMLAAGSPDA